MNRLFVMLSSLCGALLLLTTLACSRSPALPVAGDTCADITDCALSPGLSCQGGTCVELACARTVNCPAGAACVRGVCGGAQCFFDADCEGEGERCFEGECRADLCEDRSQCGEGEVCLGTPPLCQPAPETCTRDEECPAEQACKLDSGRCAPACAELLPCEGGAWCDAGVCRAQCQLQSQCDATERCIQGLCRAPLDCSSLPACGEDSVARDPFTCQCVSCLQDQDCLLAQGELCVEGSCTRCVSTPTPSSSCEDQSLFPIGERCCAACRSDGDCDSAGVVCERGRCLDLRQRGCTQDGDCPSPLVCDGRSCVLDPSTTACQLQSECGPTQGCYGDGRCHDQAESCPTGCNLPSRCLAEVGAPIGSCVGCQQDCAQQGCPDQMRCHVPRGATEGWCVTQELWSGLCAD